MNSKLRFQGKRVIAESDVKFGEVLFSFESDKIVTIHDLMNSKYREVYLQIYENHKEGNLWINEIALASFLCAEYRNPTSDILPYLESLPSRKSVSTTDGMMFYSKNVSERLLRGTSALNTLRRLRGYVEEIFNDVLVHSSLFSDTPLLSLGELEYAVGIVLENAFEIDFENNRRMIALLPGFDALRHDSHILPHSVKHYERNGSVVVKSMSTFLKGQEIRNNYFGTSSKDEMMIPSLDEAVLRYGIELQWIQPLHINCVRVFSSNMICRNGTTISSPTQCNALESLLDDLDNELLSMRTDVGLSKDLARKRLQYLDAEREILQYAYTGACDRVRVEMKVDDDDDATMFLNSKRLFDFVTTHLFLLSKETLDVVAHLLNDREERVPFDVLKSLEYEISLERRRRVGHTLSLSLSLYIHVSYIVL